MRILADTLALFIPSLALAQTSPGLVYGKVPTPSQWNSYFAAKQDYLSCAGFLFGASGGATVCIPPASTTAVLNAIETATGSYGSMLINGGALGTPASANLSNATNIPTSGLVGTIYTSQAPALSGDCTSTAGTASLACTKTGGVPFGALATLTPGTGVSSALQSAVNGASGLLQINSSGYIPATPSVGVSTNSNAATGNVGEIAMTDIVSGSAITNTTSGTAYNVTSTALSLSAGDWDCEGKAVINNTTANITSAAVWLSPATVAAIPSAYENGGALTTVGANVYTNFGGNYAIPSGRARVLCTSSACVICYNASCSSNLSGGSSAAIYLADAAYFSSGTTKSYGNLTCRRMR